MNWIVCLLAGLTAACAAAPDGSRNAALGGGPAGSALFLEEPRTTFETDAVSLASESSDVFAALWDAAEALPDEKQKRLKPAFLEVVSLGGDAGLAEWEMRLGEKFRPRPAYAHADTAADALALIEEQGRAAFWERARSGAAPFNIGRPQILSAVAIVTRDEAFAAEILKMMLTSAQDARGPADFEGPMMAHGAAEAAMARCEGETFERASALTLSPDSLRYALWRARIEGGGVDHLIPRIRAEADSKDTRFVRQALEGYRAILERGYCKSAK